ncbi:MAG: hypothetical protein ACYTFG_13970 [Planctomycetota bacterium]|jgi:hypothetical protein
MNQHIILQGLTICLSLGLIVIASVWLITIREERDFRRSSLLKKVRLSRRARNLTKVLAYFSRRRA